MGCIEDGAAMGGKSPFFTRTSRAKDGIPVLEFGLDGQPAIRSADGLHWKQRWDEPEKIRVTPLTLITRSICSLSRSIMICASS
jgi:hypothetical protein